MPTTAQREQVAELLRQSYLRLHQPSGEVYVQDLSFSANPKNWSITAGIRQGKRYPGRKGKTRKFRTDVALVATLSPAWITDPDAHFQESPNPVDRALERFITQTFRSGTTTAAHDPGSFIIAGIEQLPPPDSIDKLEVIHRTHTPTTPSGLTLQTVPVFRFTKDHVSEVIGVPGKTDTQGDIEVCTKLFHTMLANRAIQRLVPPNNKRNALRVLNSFATAHIKPSPN